MKKLLPILVIATAVTACDIYVVEPRYDRRDSLTGNYEVKEYSETYGGYTYYSLSISKANAYDEIWLHNFYAADIRVLAYIDGDRMTIPLQVVNGYEVEGTGVVHYDELHLNYTVHDLYDHSPTDFCQADAWME